MNQRQKCFSSSFIIPLVVQLNAAGGASEHVILRLSRPFLNFHPMPVNVINPSYLKRNLLAMRRLTVFLALAFTLALTSAVAKAQQTFTSDNADYTLELPSDKWRVTQEPDSLHEHAEFIYGDRNDGYLRIRKEVVEAGTTASDVSQRDQDQKLHFMTGYVEGKEDKFAGRLSGVTFAYEFTSGGKPMAGRIYYLQADSRTVYALRFTGLRDRLAQIRNQTDAIARSFHRK
jgi:hypothetical protein